MNTMFDLVQMTRDEWRELGFFYEINDENKKWIFCGSRNGLDKLAEILIKFSRIKSNDKLFEHDHYGPYSYLKIQCYTEPIISKNAIMGSLSDLEYLGEIIKKYVKLAKPGTYITIDKEYSQINEYIIEIRIEEDNFDPSQPDSLITNEYKR